MFGIVHWLGALLHPLTLVSLILIIFITKRLLFLSTRCNKNLPPSPPRFPIIGNLLQLGVHPHRSLLSLAQRHGPIMLLHLGSAPTLVVSSADGAREIMKTHDIIFSNRPKSTIGRRLLYDYKDLSLAPYGEYWRQMRSICVLQLLSAKRVQSFRSVREEETMLLMKKIEQSCSLSTSVNLSDLLASLTNDVICRVVFGRKYDEVEGGKKFKILLEEFSALLGVFSVGDFIPWLSWVNYINGLYVKADRNFREFDHFLDGVVDDHIARRRVHGDAMREDQMDFVDVLLEIKENRLINGISMGRENLKAIILDMFAAGAETTYAALEWTMAEIIRHPQVMKEAQKEIRNITGNKPHVSEEDVEKMHILKAVIKESFRLHPPIPLLVPRESTEDVRVQGFDVLAKTRVIINAWAIGRDPVWWDDPEEFRPERFLDSSIDYKGQDFQLIPFGSGRRGCPGATFAVATNEIVLANLLHKFNWSLPGGAKPEDLDVTESTGLSVRTKFPLVVSATSHSF